MLQKSIFTLLLTVGITALSFAQPVLNNAVVPKIGDVVKITEADTLNVNPGNAGANQTWNFSSWHIASGTTPTQYLYLSPVGTPYASDFPTANIVTKIDQDTAVYAYFRSEPNQYALLGVESLVFVQNLSDPDAQLKFPTNYNGSYLEDFAYTTDAYTGVIFYSYGSRTVKYDAYGTLITPLGTFPNAIRFKGVSSQIDSAEFFGIKIINHTFLTTYGWLAAGHPGTLATVYYTNNITETYYPGLPVQIETSPVTKSANYISTSSVGVFDLVQTVEGISDLNVGPNPAVDHLTLRFNANNLIQNLQVQVSDASGRVLQTGVVESIIGANEWPLAVANFPPGNYFLTLTDGRGMQTMSWIKQ